MMSRQVWIASGVRTPFTRVDAGLAKRKAIGLVHAGARTMAERTTGPIDSAVWRPVIPASDATAPSQRV